MKKSILAFAVMIAMLLSLTACTSSGATTQTPVGTATTKADETAAATTDAMPTPAEGKYPSYLNLTSERPVIKQGEGQDVTISIAINQPANGGKWDKLWIANYYQKYLNLNIKCEQILDSALDERKNLMFASGNLPDIMMNLGVNPTNQVKYGMQEGQLLKLDEYINAELTPNINSRIMQQHPALKALCTAPDGHVYGLPNIFYSQDEGAIPRLFINQTWLNKCGIGSPKTLDDFLAMARAFKEKDPAGVGADKLIPIGGNVKDFNIGFYILNAMGYNIGQGADDFYGLNPCVRNNDAELPCGNAELFKEYLGIMKTMYDEGLISKNYFIADSTEATAQLNAGQVGLWPNVVYVNGVVTWNEWNSVFPLTSQWNDTPIWRAPSAGGMGGFSVSAKTEYPEACLRFADVYFGQDCFMLWVGAVDGTEEALGYLGPKNDGKWDVTWDDKKFPADASDLWTYLMAYNGPSPQFGAINDGVTADYYKQYRKGAANPGTGRTFDVTQPDAQYRSTVYTNLLPYAKSSGFPDTFYLTEDKTTKLSDLSAVIEPFVEEQVARFVTGERPLTEFDSYIADLKKIGFDEYQQIYKDIWADYVKAQGN